MTKLEHIEYWKLSSEKDLPTVEILIEKAQYPQALFFGHLVLEKILKAHWVKDNDENAPPKIHNLIKLVNQTNLVFDADDLNFLEIMNTYQIEGRYHDYLFTLYKVSTKAHSENLLIKVKQIHLWLISQL